MELSELILFFIIAILFVAVIQKAAKSLATIALITAIISFIYLFVSGNASHLTNPNLDLVFRKNNVSQLHENYCCRGCVKETRPVCTCIIEPIYKEMVGIYSPRQLYEIENNSGRGISPEVKRVLDFNRDNINQCLSEKNTTRKKIIKQFTDFLERQY